MTVWSIVGTISGTSADGIDLAEIKTDGREVSAFGAAETVSYRPETRTRVLEAAAKKGTDREAWPNLARAVTEDHAEAVGAFLGKHALVPDAVVFHGQTVWHDPDAGETVQLGDPQLLADILKLRVIGDVRLADMAAGGQGRAACSGLPSSARAISGRRWAGTNLLFKHRGSIQSDLC
jgi:anhydro-N-acetylmuramic acid kinase